MNKVPLSISGYNSKVSAQELSQEGKHVHVPILS